MYSTLHASSGPHNHLVQRSQEQEECQTGCSVQGTLPLDLLADPAIILSPTRTPSCSYFLYERKRRCVYRMLRVAAVETAPRMRRLRLLSSPLFVPTGLES